jgi:OHCU decarboxylase
VSDENRLLWLNSLLLDEAVQELMKCCGSRRWAELVAEQRPFHTIEQLIERAHAVWWSLNEQDWLEAFRAHPRIGEKKAATTGSAQSQQWSGQEQAGVRDAAADTVDSLGRLNREYDAKFGHIFIVCATGKSSEEMLDLLRERLTNEAADELQIAAAEQSKITELRIRKLLA